MMILYSAFPHPFKSCKFLARQAIHFRRGLFLSSTKMFRAATLANYAYVSKDVISKCCILHPPNYTRILKRPKLKIPFLKKSSRPFYLLEKQEEFCASHFRQYIFFGNKDFFFVKYAFFIKQKRISCWHPVHISLKIFLIRQPHHLIYGAMRL